MPLEDMPLEALIAHVKQANQDFLHNRPHNNAYAYELFRRALVLRANDALEAVHEIYFPQFRRWARRHPSFPYTDETDEYFAAAGFARFYHAIPGDKFAKFETLPPLLSYARLCVTTAIAQYARDHANHDVPMPTSDIQDRHNPMSELEAAELWDQILDRLTSEKQRRLAYLVFVLHMKPAEIVATYPEEWDNERSVSVALHRIRKSLRGDDGLHEYREG